MKASYTTKIQQLPFKL